MHHTLECFHGVVSSEQVCFPSVPETGCQMMVLTLWPLFRGIASSVTQWECPRGLLLSWTPGEIVWQGFNGALFQEDKPHKVAWSIQPQRSHAIQHVSMVVQGIKKADKLSRMPLCKHTSRTNSFKLLRPTEVFNKKKNYKWIHDLDYSIKPPHLDGYLGSFTMPATSMPAGCLNASEELTRRAANYGTIADVMFS